MVANWSWNSIQMCIRDRAALHVLQQDPAGVLLVLPADHLIRNEGGFRDAVASGLPQANAGALVTFGIKPDAPVTGYGYIRIGQVIDGAVPVSYTHLSTGNRQGDGR